MTNPGRCFALEGNLKSSLTINLSEPGATTLTGINRLGDACD